MRGELVFVRDVVDRLLIRRVWDVAPTAIFICSEETYQKLAADLESDWLPIGWPIEDVYYYNEELARLLNESGRMDSALWHQLTPYGTHLESESPTP